VYWHRNPVTAHKSFQLGAEALSGSNEAPSAEVDIPQPRKWSGEDQRNELQLRPAPGYGQLNVKQEFIRTTGATILGAMRCTAIQISATGSLLAQGTRDRRLTGRPAVMTHDRRRDPSVGTRAAAPSATEPVQSCDHHFGPADLANPSVPPVEDLPAARPRDMPEEHTLWADLRAGGNPVNGDRRAVRTGERWSGGDCEASATCRPGA